jgi:single-strand DNA-binding protein
MTASDLELTTIKDNSIFLRGILPAQAQERVLANGTEVAIFQVVVQRPEGAGAKSDTLDCACSAANLRRQVARYAEGDRIEVIGRLQRRFWRGTGGVASRYEVEVESLRRTKKS